MWKGHGGEVAVGSKGTRWDGEMSREEGLGYSLRLGRRQEGTDARHMSEYKFYSRKIKAKVTKLQTRLETFLNLIFSRVITCYTFILLKSKSVLERKKRRLKNEYKDWRVAGMHHKCD